MQQIVPGARVTVVGISSVFSSGNSDRDSKGKDGAVALKQPYIRVVGMEEMKDGSATVVSGRDNETFTKAEELAFMVMTPFLERVGPSRRAMTIFLISGAKTKTGFRTGQQCLSEYRGPNSAFHFRS